MHSWAPASGRGWHRQAYHHASPPCESSFKGSPVYRLDLALPRLQQLCFQEGTLQSPLRSRPAGAMGARGGDNCPLQGTARPRLPSQASCCLTVQPQAAPPPIRASVSPTIKWEDDRIKSCPAPQPQVYKQQLLTNFTEPWDPAFRKLHKHPSEKQKSNLKTFFPVRISRSPFYSLTSPILLPLFQISSQDLENTFGFRLGSGLLGVLPLGCRPTLLGSFLLRTRPSLPPSTGLGHPEGHGYPACQRRGGGQGQLSGNKASPGQKSALQVWSQS